MKKATDSYFRNARDGSLILSQIGRFTRTLQNGGLPSARYFATRLNIADMTYAAYVSYGSQKEE